MSRSSRPVRHRLAGVLLACGLLAAPLQSSAQPAPRRSEQDQARDAVRDGRLTPLSQVLATLAARTPGEHLDTRFGETVDGRPVYLVTWRTPDNRVVVFVVDARTGRVLDQRGD
jgi:uncharacterized membrane protein YkoI